MRFTRPWSLALGAAALQLAAAGAQAQTGNVAALDARTNIFSAGGNANTGDGLAPTAIALTPGTGRTLTLSNVTGSVGCAFGAAFNADGVDSGNNPCVNFAIVNTSGVISGVEFRGDGATTPNGRSIALVGLFLGASLPGTAPMAGNLVYGTTGLSYSSTSYAPFALGQVFYLGDGLTGVGNGTQQSFAVPDGATRLYFGFVDAPGYQGNPGAYSGDNVGTLAFDYTVSAAATAAPEPATLALVAGGLALVGAAARRRRTA